MIYYPICYKRTGGMVLPVQLIWSEKKGMASGQNIGIKIRSPVNALSIKVFSKTLCILF